MRFFRYTILLFALVLWGGGLSSTISHWLYEIGFIADDYRFGDLYRLSALPQFKMAQPDCAPSHRSSDTASTQLYLIGDSFTEPQRLSESDFQVSLFQRVAWYNQQRIQLNPDKRNVLIIETVERHFREHLAIPIIEFIVEKDTTQLGQTKPSLRKRISDDLHRTDIEERLESTLFSQNWAFWFKELKASLTLNWFNRTNSKVSLSKDKQNLFLKMDTDTTQKLLSSFSELSDQEVNTLVDSVNAVASRYRQLGFDEVYLSIIPNKASILETNRSDYNHLIERVQNNPKLVVPYIDTYDLFKRATPSPYLKSDTHWNCEGRAIWLEQIRQKVRI
ncbi:hypothetical protein [Spirosoma foliorum]|uniref:AlgX/AlgJ SGNH hydrolase-like domain-containing protein n=1 Tax=Spirosoma foliorum TaxID=2710596 RepID=A0A7G5H4A3_9BACT|nr:hypothetical protein [Spirosoma foliorum]QMW05945.1 hypothetical protein H3H32_14125 [Spirosoma foliorum]